MDQTQHLSLVSRQHPEHLLCAAGLGHFPMALYYILQMSIIAPPPHFITGETEAQRGKELLNPAASDCKPITPLAAWGTEHSPRLLMESVLRIWLARLDRK